VLGRRRLEQRAVARQARVDVLQKGACADVVEAVRVAEVPVHDLVEPAVRLDLVEIAHGGLDEAAVAMRAERPGDRPRLADVECDPDVGMKEAIDLDGRGVGDGVVDDAVGHARQQSLDILRRVFQPGQARRGHARRLERFRIAAAGDDLDAPACGVSERARRPRAPDHDDFQRQPNFQ
jgi:hypothetical protein